MKLKFFRLNFIFKYQITKIYIFHFKQRRITTFPPLNQSNHYYRAHYQRGIQ